MNQEIDNTKQKARLALIMKTSKLRLWFYDPTTRHYCNLSEAGDYEREYNPADFALFFHRDDLDQMRAMVFAICEGKMDTAKVHVRSRAEKAGQGEPDWHDMYLRAIAEYEDGKPVNIIATINDETETKRARESGEMKTLFLANMTHEIRTPINAIVGFSEVLSSLPTAEDKKGVIQIIKNNCDMLLRLINDILTASSLETGHMVVRPVSVDFSKTFNELFESLQPRVQELGVEFIKDNPYDTLTIKVDVERVIE